MTRNDDASGIVRYLQTSYSRTIYNTFSIYYITKYLH